MKHSKSFLYIIVCACIIASCSKSGDIQPVDPIIPVLTDTTSNPVPSPLTENFEEGVKAEYPTSSIALSTGKWSFNEAVIGTLAEDKKNGSKSARLREAGKLTMNFDIVGGVYRVVIASASYDNDAPGSWQLWASNNSGYAYTMVGSNITVSGSLRNDTIIVNATGKVRFSIRKVAGSNRINIDDIQAILTSGPLPPTYADDANMLMGNPSNATPSLLDFTNYYMNKTYYSLAYNSQRNIANWVSWHLHAADLGPVPRQDDFREDYALPSSWYYVSNASYTGSGFDRGHSCPSGDRTSTVEANSSTFLMTNIIPQAPNNNQQTWERLEDSCRRLVQLGNELFIITGSYGTGGDGNNGAANDIDFGRIVVPASIWKVIVVIPNGNNDLNRVSAASRVIAVLAPNTNSINTNWKTFRTSVDSIETLTGYNLLSNLPEAVQLVVEARIDNL